MPTTQVIDTVTSPGWPSGAWKPAVSTSTRGALAAQVLGGQGALRLSAGECGGGGRRRGRARPPGRRLGRPLGRRSRRSGCVLRRRRRTAAGATPGPAAPARPTPIPAPRPERSWRGPFDGADGGLGDRPAGQAGKEAERGAGDGHLDAARRAGHGHVPAGEQVLCGLVEEALGGRLGARRSRRAAPAPRGRPPERHPARSSGRRTTGPPGSASSPAAAPPGR